MKIVFVSNYFNHHQQAFSDAMSKLIGENYTFVATSEMREERKQLGYGINQMPGYVKKAHTSYDALLECSELINNADVVIAGSTPEKLLKYRIKQNKLLIRYQERIFRQELSFIKCLKRAIAWYKRNPKNKNIYLLCASGFTSADYKRLGLFKNKAYKWGYFPTANTYNIHSLMEKKNKTKILWCGRFLPLKHPEYALYVAERLKNEGYDFSIDYIGNGELEEYLKYNVKQLKLEGNVTFLGAMKPDNVRKHMEKSAIFMFTSNFEEGWGAVLNEAMNSGCAVVASHAIGSVPFLMKHKENGLIYKNEDIDELYCKIKYLLDNPNEQKRLGENAYHTIVDLWNANVAAERLLKFVEQIKENGQCDLFADGPCSRAKDLKNDWFEGDCLCNR